MDRVCDAQADLISVKDPTHRSAAIESYRAAGFWLHTRCCEIYRSLRASASTARIRTALDDTRALRSPTASNVTEVPRRGLFVPRGISQIPFRSIWSKLRKSGRQADDSAAEEGRYGNTITRTITIQNEPQRGRGIFSRAIRTGRPRTSPPAQTNGSHRSTSNSLLPDEVAEGYRHHLAAQRRKQIATYRRNQAADQERHIEEERNRFVADRINHGAQTAASKNVHFNPNVLEHSVGSMDGPSDPEEHEPEGGAQGVDPLSPTSDPSSSSIQKQASLRDSGVNFERSLGASLNTRVSPQEASQKSDRKIEESPNATSTIPKWTQDLNDNEHRASGISSAAVRNDPISPTDDHSLLAVNYKEVEGK